jgi:fluoroquinolone transport system permease protein
MKTLFLGDVRFQFKYGFYFIYLLFSVLYISLVFAFPESWREKAAVLMIFTDPSAMASISWEQSSSLRKREGLGQHSRFAGQNREYVLSKLFSIGFISTAVGLAIGIPAGIVSKPFYFISGVFLCSCLFSSVGLIVACRISTLNQFVIATIPAEILINVPAVIWLFWYRKSWLLLHPGACMIELCSGGAMALPALILLSFLDSADERLCLQRCRKNA